MAIVIRLNAPFDGRSHYFVRDDYGVHRYTFNQYRTVSHDAYFAVDEYYELVYPCMDAVPNCLRDMLSQPLNTYQSNGKAIDRFNLAIEVAREYMKQKEEDVKMSVNTGAAIKGLMLFNTDEDTRTYDKDVFVWDSVNGVQRMTFPEYLAKIERSHDATYKMVKLSMARLNGLAVADFRYLKSAKIPHNGGDKSETMKMVFRTLWYGATGEEMPI